MEEPYSWFAFIVFALAIINVSRSLSVIIIIILVAKIKVTLSHTNVAGTLYTSRCHKWGIGQMSVIQQQQHSDG